MNPLFHLDILSEKSRYRGHPTGEKLLFSLGTLCLTLIMKPFPFALLASISLILFLLRSGVRPADLALLLVVPAAFLFSAMLPLLIELDASPLIAQHSLDSIHLRLSTTGMHLASETALRSMTALLCIYALTATTPMPRILSALRGRWMPETLLDVLYFSHRMIHIFMGTAHVVVRAQKARGGERNFRVRFRSRVILWHRLYDRVRDRVLRMERGLLSRGYRGELRFLSLQGNPSTAGGMLQILLFQAVLVAISLAFPLLTRGI